MSGIANLADLLNDGETKVLEVSNFYDVPDHGNDHDHVVLAVMKDKVPYACVCSIQTEDVHGFKSYLKSVIAGQKVSARFTKRVGKVGNEKGEQVDDPSDVSVSVSPVPSDAVEETAAEDGGGTKTASKK